MFSNPIGLAAARRTCTSGISAVKNYGGPIWEAMCFRFEGFTTHDIVRELVVHSGLTPCTAEHYVRAFMAYARACPDDFSGPGSRLVRDRLGFRLADNPER